MDAVEAVEVAVRVAIAHRLGNVQEEFRKHHVDKYGAAMPIWVAIELSDFGLLSRF